MTGSPTHPPESAVPTVAAAAELAGALRKAVAQAVVGQAVLVDRLLIGLFTGGHVLVEGLPGLAKTLTVSSLAQAAGVSFGRVQFTPDLLPADVVGTQIFRPADGTFESRPGPIFANIVLADEVNRAPAKVQSALLEAMQERRVTIGDETHRLPDPFLVLATQNPIEQEGTYPLPEAQVDRFMLKVDVGYPDVKEEREILDLAGSVSGPPVIEPVTDGNAIRGVRAMVDKVHADDRLKDYIIQLVRTTRDPAEAGVSLPLELDRLVDFGASPRAALAMLRAARAHALLASREAVIPSDIKAVAMDVLRHRVLVSYEAEAESVTSADVVRCVLDHVPVP